MVGRVPGIKRLIVIVLLVTMSSPWLDSVSKELIDLAPTTSTI